MANNLWSNYTEKTATPVDADEVMVRDSTDGKNKRLLFGTFWKWIAKKLNEATISELETDNKTVVGAINYLYGKTFLLSSPTKNLDGIDLNEVTVGIYAITDKCLNTPPILSRGTLIVSVPEVTGYVRQVYLGGYRNDIYSRVKYYNSTTNKFEWKKWETIFSE